MKNYTIVVADLHGRFDIFTVALEKIKQYLGKDQGTIVFLGDYVDRGPQSAQILDALIKGPTEPNQKWITLKGNHEELMEVGLRDGPDKNPDMWNCWIGNGGDKTIMSYKDDSLNLTGEVPVEHFKFLQSLPLVYQDPYRAYVHAWLPADRYAEDLTPDFLIWNRYGKNDDWSYFGKYIVHGHTPFSEGPIIKENRANFDTGAFFTGRLVLGIFDDEVPGKPVETMEINLERENLFSDF